MYRCRLSIGGRGLTTLKVRRLNSSYLQPNQQLFMRLLTLLLAAALLTSGAQAQSTTNYNKLLIGKHLFSLQWISWEYFGKVTISKWGEAYRIEGQQRSKSGSDYVQIKGTLTPTSADSLLFTGKITVLVKSNVAEPCVREGTFHFVRRDNRKYWRLSEMDSPCPPGYTDYVDIFLRKE